MTKHIATVVVSVLFLVLCSSGAHAELSLAATSHFSTQTDFWNNGSDVVPISPMGYGLLLRYDWHRGAGDIAKIASSSFRVGYQLARARQDAQDASFSFIPIGYDIYYTIGMGKETVYQLGTGINYVLMQLQGDSWVDGVVADPGIGLNLSGRVLYQEAILELGYEYYVNILTFSGGGAIGVQTNGVYFQVGYPLW